eukprot:gene29373-36580_t
MHIRFDGKSSCCAHHDIEKIAKDLADQWEVYKGRACAVAFESLLCGTLCNPSVSVFSPMVVERAHYTRSCDENDTIIATEYGGDAVVQGLGFCSEDCRTVERTCNLYKDALNNYWRADDCKIRLPDISGASAIADNSFCLRLRCSDSYCSDEVDGV